jgi:hypothetical protein
MLCDAPEVPNKVAFMAEYAKILKGYSADELTGATDRILRTRRYKTWPSIADCVAAAEDAREGKRHRQPAPPIADTSAWSDAATQWADNECRCEDGKIAADDGWLQGLHEFLRQNFSKGHRRWPNQAELARIMDNARFVDRCAAGEENMGVCAPALRELAKSIQERRSTLSARIFEGNREGA